MHRAKTAFALARALSQVAAGAKDRERARPLVEDALRTYRELGETHREKADAVQAWLAAHPEG